MNKKILKIIILAIIFLIILADFNIQFAESFNTTGVNINNRLANQFDDVGSTIVSTIRIVGMIFSIGALMIIGIRYMTSTVEEKAFQKESLIFYCIGAFLIFSIVNIVSVIYNYVAD